MLIQSGMKMATGCPMARPTAANEMPVLPLVASTIRAPGSIVPAVVCAPQKVKSHPILHTPGHVEVLALGEDAPPLAPESVVDREEGVCCR